MTYKEFVRKATDSLSEIYSLGESKAIALRVLTHHIHITDYEYLVDPNVIIPSSDVNILQAALDELMDQRPVQYVLGYEEFAGHKFNVSEAVLIPRPETEEMYRLIVEQWKDAGKGDYKILDACTGSGCIAYSLAAAFPKASVLACDFYDDALKVAASQQIFLDEEGRQPLRNLPAFFKWDVLSGPPDEKDYAAAEKSDSQVGTRGSSDSFNVLPNLEELDILVSNPPYVCEHEKDFMSDNVLEYEPDEALFVPDNDPLRFYRALAAWASALLRMGGKAYFEINEAYPREVVALFESFGFSEVTVVEDIHDKPRIVYFTKWF